MFSTIQAFDPFSPTPPIDLLKSSFNIYQGHDFENRDKSKKVRYEILILLFGKNREIGYWSSDAAYRDRVFYIRLYSPRPGCWHIHCRSDYCALHSVFQSPP
jgi:hypothetical protein